MGYEVAFAGQADRDLVQVVDFLAQKNPVAAARLGVALVDTAQTLAYLPRRGVIVRSRPGYWRIVHKPWYLIFYRIDEDRHVVEVARIWDARQDPAGLALS